MQHKAPYTLRPAEKQGMRFMYVKGKYFEDNIYQKTNGNLLVFNF